MRSEGTREMKSFPPCFCAGRWHREVMKRTFAVLLLSHSTEQSAAHVFDAISRATASGLSRGSAGC